MLLLSWAVHSQQNEVFIADIRTLSPDDQHCLMLLINSTMKQLGDGTLAAGNFRVGLDCKMWQLSIALSSGLSSRFFSVLRFRNVQICNDISGRGGGNTAKLH